MEIELVEKSDIQEEIEEKEICYVCQEEFAPGQHTIYKNHKCECNTFLCNDCLPMMLEKKICTICKKLYLNNVNHRISINNSIRLIQSPIHVYSIDENNRIMNIYGRLTRREIIVSISKKFCYYIFVLTVFFSMILILGYFTYEEIQLGAENDDKEEEIDFGTKFGYIILFGIVSLFFLIFLCGILLCCCTCISRRRYTVNLV